MKENEKMKRNETLSVTQLDCSVSICSPPLYLSATNLFLGPLFLGSAWVTRILLPAILAPSASVHASWEDQGFKIKSVAIVEDCG